MKTRGLWGILILFFLLFGNNGVKSQNVDWCSWVGVNVNYRINPSLRLMSKMEIRAKDDLSDFERVFINAGVGYKVLPRWELRSVVAYHRRSTYSKGDFNAYRYHIGSEATWNKGDFRILWRERFQHTFFLGDDEIIIRSRLKFDYNIPSTILKPYFSIEAFNNVERYNFLSSRADRIRYTPGLGMKFSPVYSMSVFYCRQDDGAKKSNIAGVEFFINI